MERKMTIQHIRSYGEYLRREERSANTISKYLHDLQSFTLWSGSRVVNKELVSQWKLHLQARGRAAVSVNSALAALHGFFSFMGWEDCRVKYLKLQRQVFRDASRDLSKGEFRKLVDAAKRQGKQSLSLLMECICGTGIRVSELKYITVEALKRGRADVSLKGKIRTILIPKKLGRKLQKYAQKEKITRGEIFLNASGRSITRRQIWGEMKALCKAAAVDASKVFPHNLRHLFARTFYQSCKDIVRLADVLGHSSIDTTRIYLVTTGAEYARELDKLDLVS